MYFMTKFNIGFGLLFAYLLWSNIGLAIGQNTCIGCGLVFDNCKGPTNSVLANSFDVTLIQPRKLGERVDDSVDRCLPLTHKLIGNLDDYICFQQPACYVVASDPKYNTEDEKNALCKKCGSFCGCKEAVLPKWAKKGDASKSLNIEAFKCVIFIAFLHLSHIL